MVVAVRVRVRIEVRVDMPVEELMTVEVTELCDLELVIQGSVTSSS